MDYIGRKRRTDGRTGGMMIYGMNGKIPSLDEGEFLGILTLFFSAFYFSSGPCPCPSVHSISSRFYLSSFVSVLVGTRFDLLHG